MSILTEHLTPEQEKAWSGQTMSNSARAGTDHVFGEGNLEIHEPLEESENTHKTATHLKVEEHLGRTIAPSEYRSGYITDKHNRQVKIGRQIKDPKLLLDYSQDQIRAGAKRGDTGFTVRIVRGHHVAGQTNPHMTDDQPTGHSWAGESCKNIDTGSRNNCLPHEIKHGTVVAFVKDHTGQEIYRATLQPFHKHNMFGETVEKDRPAYHLDSEYGIKSPAFTQHMKGLALRLSSRAASEPGDLYHIHPDVYNDSGTHTIFNPAIHPSKIADHVLLSDNTKIEDEHYLPLRDLAADPRLDHERIRKVLDAATTRQDRSLASSLQRGLVLNPEFLNADTDGLKKILSAPNMTGNIMGVISARKDLSPKHLHDIIASPQIPAHRLKNIVTHDNIDKSHIHAILDRIQQDGAESTKGAGWARLIGNPKADEETQHRAVDVLGPLHYLFYMPSRNGSITQRLIDHVPLIKNHNEQSRYVKELVRFHTTPEQDLHIMRTSPHVTPDLLKATYNANTPEIHAMIPNMSRKEVMSLMDNGWTSRDTHVEIRKHHEDKIPGILRELDYTPSHVYTLPKNLL